MAHKDIALITGGARGIGYACAEALSEMGATIIIADIDGDAAESAAQQFSGNGFGMACDVASTEQLTQVFDRIESELGPVSKLVNCAGISNPRPFLEASLEDFQSVLDVNLTGTFWATQRAARSMVENNIEGSIVNMSSINAVVSIPDITAYCASKGGVAQLTKSASLALAPHNIRVNAVGPGSIDTAMLAQVNANPEAMKTVLSRTPLKRIGTPREIGDVVAFLCSDKASYITGETIYVDGGRLGMNYTC